MQRSQIIPLTTTTAALLLSACGGDGGDEKVAPGEFANDVCTAFRAWAEPVREGPAKLQRIDSGAPPQENKDAYADFVDTAIEATDQLAEDIDAAGTLDSANGDEVADALVRSVEATKGELEDVSETVEELPTDSPESFNTASEAFTRELSAALESVGDGLQEVDAPELEKAIAEEGACQS